MDDAQSYRDHPAISQSDLKLYASNRMLFHEQKVLGKRVEKKPTPSMEFGTLVDTWLLNPDQLMEIPREVLSASGSRAGKAWKAFEQEHEGKLLVKAEDIEKCHAIADFMKQYQPKAWNALFDHKKETHVRRTWECPYTGLERKAELDIWLPEYRMIIDVKTSSDPSPVAFRKQAALLGYEIQAATYTECMEVYEEEPRSYVIIAIRNEAPYDCERYEIAAEWLGDGEAFNRRWMMRLAADMRKNDWRPVTADHAHILTRPPGYAGRTWDDEYLCGDQFDD